MSNAVAEGLFLALWAPPLAVFAGPVLGFAPGPASGVPPPARTPRR